MPVNIKKWVLLRDASERGDGFLEAIRQVSAPAPDGVFIEMDDLVKVHSAFPKMPSLIEKAGNLASAASRITSAAMARKNILVPAELREFRRKLCLSCPQWIKDKSTCAVCGCKGLKWHIATERCPIGKWERWTA